MRKYDLARVKYGQAPPPMIHDLEYVIETRGTAMRRLLAQRLPIHPAAAGPNAMVLSPSTSILSLRSSGTSGGEELPLWRLRRYLHKIYGWKPRG